MPKARIAGIYPVREDLRKRRKIVEESKLPQESKDKILEFLDACTARALSPHREAFYATYLKQIAMIMGPSFTKPTRKDVERMLATVESRDYEAWTKYSYRTATKRFYKWLLGNDEEYPPEVRWVKVTTNGTSSKLPEDLLTREDVQALIHVCQNERDRAFVALLADSGARISEILTLRIRDVSFDQYGMVLNVQGKTGERRVRVIGDSIAYVATWLEVHPAGKNRDSPLFTGVNEMSRKNVMSYAQSHKVLVSLKARSGLKKRIHPHLFRHTKMTEWAAKVPEAVLESQAGWVPGSGMAKIYVHLSGKNVDAAILKASGIDIKEEDKEEIEQTKICPRCQVSNASVMKFCRRCGLPLDLEIAIALEDERQRDVDLNPEREAMRREVAKLQLEVARLSRQLTGPGTPSAPGASRASRGATPRGPR